MPILCEKKTEKKIIRNWKNPKDYEDIKSYKKWQLAWEFLRRNTDYIQDWKKVTSGLSVKEKRYIPCNKWGLRKYLDPEKEYKGNYFCSLVPIGGTQEMRGLCVDVSELRVCAVPNNKPGRVTLIFNIYDPINSQVEYAKRILKAMQDDHPNPDKIKKTFKPRVDDFITLIRVLDAKAAKVKNKEIESVLYPGEREYKNDLKALKKVWDKIKQAEEYVKWKYRHILFMSKNTASDE
jgi:hypothetical protein